MKNLFLLIIILSLLISCKKEDPIETKNSDETAAPVIKIISPLSGNHYHQGDTVKIKAEISDNIIIKEASVHVVDNSNGAEVSHNHHYPNTTNYVLESYYVITTAKAGTYYNFKFEAADSSGNHIEKTAQIMIH